MDFAQIHEPVAMLCHIFSALNIWSTTKFTRIVKTVSELYNPTEIVHADRGFETNSLTIRNSLGYISAS